MFQSIISKYKNMNKRNKLVVMLVIAAIAAITVGTTVAYIYNSSKPAENDFTPSDISCEIEETVTNGVKQSVTVKNTGKTDAYIRVAVVANKVDTEGGIIGAANVDTYLAGADWVKSGMYYYYTKPVDPSGSTGELLKNAIPMEGIQVTILAEAIQSEPAEAAQEAWGVNPAALGSN